MSDYLQGVDISYYQNPTAIQWEELAKTHQFVIARATYGTHLDKRVERHVENARRVALAVGLYHFWTFSRDNRDQHKAFDSVAKAIRLGGGDLVPAVDVEDHGLRKGKPAKYQVSPGWSDRLHAFCTQLTAQYGRCLIYCTQRDWHRLGKPEWLLEHPLWVAHWTSRENPATPGNRPWAIWQHKVSPLPGIHAPPIDQNRAVSPLPIIGDDDWLDKATRQDAETQLKLTVDTAARKVGDGD